RRDHRAAGDRAVRDGRRVRRRNRVGDAAGRLLQVVGRQAAVSNGAGSPPLRAEGVARESSRHSCVDPHDAARAGRSLYTEAAVMDYTGKRVLVLGLGMTGLSLVLWLRKRGAEVQVADTRIEPPKLSSLRRLAPDITPQL